MFASCFSRLASFATPKRAFMPNIIPHWPAIRRQTGATLANDTNRILGDKMMIVSDRPNGKLTLVETTKDSSASCKTFQEYRAKYTLAEHDEYAVAKSPSIQVYFPPFVRPQSRILHILVEFKNLDLEQIYHLEKEVHMHLAPMRKAFGTWRRLYGHECGTTVGETETHAYKIEGEQVCAHGNIEFSIPSECVSILGGIAELYGVTFVGDKTECMGKMDLL
ncbi:hypothetical protein CERZMDRAFT_99168 [Cercospora zeae-maydis SCOH1-5]|uniref:Uncharacterized protein n=1 Tax=Cercospora zeae-maydis SCOH1-5 TaxID=717836 RepID=A0A6A6FAS9_9PEZI|nr:hypothetical protein CERZMDRAFT_99168 [Cercospora zeae-maydis SCOH1-5]